MTEPPTLPSGMDKLDVDMDVFDGGLFSCVRPADKLEGRVRVASKQPLHFTRAEVYLHGAEKTTAVSGDGTQRNGSKTFLDIGCRPSLPQEPNPEMRISKYKYSIPFLFVIPDGCEFASLSHQMFPPSFNTLNAYFHSWSPISLPKISISYSLQVVLTYSFQTPITADSPITVIMSKPIQFLPYSEVPPPIDADSFPNEFTLSVRQPLWKSILYGRLGFVAITTKEPQPLAYSSDQALVSTECDFDITIECDPTAIRRLRYITVVADPVICAKTYYSYKKLTCTPSQNLLTDNGPLHIHRDLQRLDSQSFQNFQWTFTRMETPIDETPEHRRGSAPPSYGEASVRQDSYIPSTSNGVPPHWLGSSSSDRQYAGRLQTSICVPITPSRRLQPTFSGHMIARAYSLLFNVSLGGAYASKMNLEVPLQVAYPRPAMLPLQEDDTYLPLAEDEGAECGRGRRPPIRLPTHANSNPYATPSEEADLHDLETLPTYDELMS